MELEPRSHVHMGLPSESSSTHTVADTVLGLLPSGSYPGYCWQADVSLPYSEGPHIWTSETSWLWSHCTGACPAVEILCLLLCLSPSGPGPSPWGCQVSTHLPHPHPGSVICESDLLTHCSPYFSFINGHPPCMTKDSLPEALGFTATDSRCFFTEAERSVPVGTTAQAPSSSPHQLLPMLGNIPFGE